MSIPFSELIVGAELDPLTVAISAAANDRYWEGAGVDHPLRAAGALYPLIAANLTILTFGRLCADAMIQTRQRLVCHRRANAPATLQTRGRVSERYERRGRTYIVVEMTVHTAVETTVHTVGETTVSLDRADAADDDGVLWSSTVVFTPAATL